MDAAPYGGSVIELPLTVAMTFALPPIAERVDLIRKRSRRPLNEIQVGLGMALDQWRILPTTAASPLRQKAAAARRTSSPLERGKSRLQSRSSVTTSPWRTSGVLPPRPCTPIVQRRLSAARAWNHQSLGPLMPIARSLGHATGAAPDPTASIVAAPLVCVSRSWVTCPPRRSRSRHRTSAHSPCRRAAAPRRRCRRCPWPRRRRSRRCPRSRRCRPRRRLWSRPRQPVP